MRTLIVDDDEEYRSMLKVAFEHYGTVCIAVNGTEAFKEFSSALKASRPYHLIILDLNMPMRGGVETVASVRQMERKLKLFEDAASLIIAVSGLDLEVEAERAIRAGCDEFVSKTEGVRSLIEVIKNKGIFDEGRDESFDQKVATVIYSEI